MTPEQILTLKVGDRVEWRADLAENAHHNARGTVSEIVGQFGFAVLFDDGDEIVYSFTNCRKVHRI